MSCLAMAYSGCVPPFLLLRTFYWPARQAAVRGRSTRCACLRRQARAACDPRAQNVQAGYKFSYECVSFTCRQS